MSRSISKLIIAVIAIGLIAAGCGKGGDGANGANGTNGTDAVDRGTITGTVSDSGGNPVANVVIATSPDTSSATSDAGGSFTLSNVSVGVYTVTATVTGYYGSASGVGVAAGNTTTVDIVVSATPVAGKVYFTVTDTAGSAAAGATVYAIPATDVALLSQQTLTLSSGNYTADALNVDEPLEDLINGNYTPAGGGVGTYQSAVTDSSGAAVIENMAVGTTDMYFLYVQPAGSDTKHLPGGSLCRTAVSGASLNGVQTSIELSTTPSSYATFVGSSACLGCHADKADTTKTMHKLGIRAMGADSGLQNASEFTSGDYDIDKAMASKMSTTTGTTIYFYDYDSSRKFDKFKTLESDPTGSGGDVYATVRVYKDDADGKYKAEFTNVKNGSDPNSPMTHEIKMSYGGGVYKQRYMTAINNSIYLIPLQFNQRGDEASSDRVRKQWRDYHMDWWISSPGASQTFKTVPTKTFDAECAACHFNGFSYDTSKMQATAVADPNGETHPVLGTKQELNIGCETCHGPASEHVAAGGNGKFIVSPQNITPERSSMICGQCHSRPQGKGTWGANDAPVDANNRMMRAGTSRADFLASNTSRHDAASSDLWTDGKHAKSHHQQYTDLIQTKKYRNGSRLLTCANCHDPHGPGTDRHQLSGVSDNSKCQGCHTDKSVSGHQTTYATSSMGSSVTCILCHNTKTSTSGAGLNQTASEGKTGGTSGTVYLQGDITSHLFDVPTQDLVPMPVPFTNPCGGCHDMSSL